MLKISLRMFKLSLFRMFMLTKLFTFKLSLLKINYSGGLGLKAWREQSKSHCALTKAVAVFLVSC